LHRNIGFAQSFLIPASDKLVLNTIGVISMSSHIVDFAKEKEEGYQRIFDKPPLLSSASTHWDELLICYDHFLPGQTPEICAKQHGIAIFVNMPKPAQVKRIIDGRCVNECVAQGDMVIVPADTWTQTYSDTAAGAILVSLDTQVFARTIEETTERNSIELIPHFSTPDPLIHQIGLALKRALENAESTSRLYAETMTNALMMHMLQSYCAQRLTLPTYTGGLSKLKLQRVLDYIYAHLDCDLSLKELAAIVQISPHYFAQLFKQSTGISPHQYVIQQRIKRARELLKKQELTIADVAKIVGFVDQSHFHRHFKRLVGITPKAFLQQTRL
jgi:AraC family transcriptional regulator